MSRRLTNPPVVGQPVRESTVIVEEAAQAPPSVVGQATAATAARAPPSTVVQSVAPAAARPASVVQSTTPAARVPSAIQSTTSGTPRAASAFDTVNSSRPSVVETAAPSTPGVNHGRHHIPGYSHLSNVPVVGSQARHPHILPHHAGGTKRRRRCPRWCCYCLAFLLLCALLTAFAVVLLHFMKKAMKSQLAPHAPKQHWENSDVSRRFHKDCVTDGPFRPHTQEWLDVEAYTHMKDNNIAELLVVIQDWKKGAGNCHYTRRFINDGSVTDPRVGFHNFNITRLATVPEAQTTVLDGARVSGSLQDRIVSSRVRRATQQNMPITGPLDKSGKESRPDFPPLIVNDYSVFRGRTKSQGWKIAVFARPARGDFSPKERDNAMKAESLANNLRFISTRPAASKADADDYVWRAYPNENIKTKGDHLQVLHREPHMPIAHSHKFIRADAPMAHGSVHSLEFAATNSPSVNDGFDLQSPGRDPEYEAKTQIATSMVQVFDEVYVARDIHVGGEKQQQAEENAMHKYSLQLAEFVYDMPKKHQTTPWEGKDTKTTNTSQPKAFVLYEQPFSPYNDADHAGFIVYFREDIFSHLKQDELKDIDVTSGEEAEVLALQTDPSAIQPSTRLTVKLNAMESQYVSAVVSNMFTFVKDTLSTQLPTPHPITDEYRREVSNQLSNVIRQMEQEWTKHAISPSRRNVLKQSIWQLFVDNLPESFPVDEQDKVNMLISILHEQKVTPSSNLVTAFEEPDYWNKDIDSVVSNMLPWLMQFVKTFVSSNNITLPLSAEERQQLFAKQSEAFDSLVKLGILDPKGHEVGLAIFAKVLDSLSVLVHSANTNRVPAIPILDPKTVELIKEHLSELGVKVPLNPEVAAFLESVIVPLLTHLKPELEDQAADIADAVMGALSDAS